MALLQHKNPWLLSVVFSASLIGCNIAYGEEKIQSVEDSETARSHKMTKFSGYLDNYDELIYMKNQNAFVFNNPKNKGQYNKIYLDEVSLHNQAGVMDEALAKQSTDYIRESIERILKSRGVFSTDKSGEGVAVLKMAITGTEKTKKELSIANSIPEPFVFIVNKENSNPEELFVEAAMESELVDPNSNERLHAIVKIAVAKAEKHSREGLTFDDVIPVIDSWLIQFEETVDAFKTTKGEDLQSVH